MAHPSQVGARRPPFGAVLLCVLCSSAAQSQNLVSNGGFDSGTLVPWQIVQPGYVMWNGFDYAAHPLSGSALLSNADSANTIHFPLSQCVVLDRPAHVLRYGFAGYLPAGPTAGYVGVNIRHGSPASSQCGVPPYVGNGSLIATADNVWHVRHQTYVLPQTLPAGSELDILLVVNKYYEGGSFHGYLDNVYVENDSLLRSGFD